MGTIKDQFIEVWSEGCQEWEHSKIPQGFKLNLLLHISHFRELINHILVDLDRLCKGVEFPLVPFNGFWGRETICIEKPWDSSAVDIIKGE